MEGNPFWSEKAREELQVQMVRPEELPHQEEIPEGVREEVGGESTTRVLQGQHDEDRERSRERRRSTVGTGRGQKMEFSTPLGMCEPFACLQPSCQLLL